MVRELNPGPMSVGAGSDRRMVRMLRNAKICNFEPFWSPLYTKTIKSQDENDTLYVVNPWNLRPSRKKGDQN